MKDKNKETEGLVEELLRRMGEDPNREGLLETPGRVRRSLEYLTGGYAVDSRELVNGALFAETYDEMVVVKNIEFYSLCEHHLLPFYGRCHLGYVPNGKVVGLSKIPRFVDKFARRLQLQERIPCEDVGVVSVQARFLWQVPVGVRDEASKFGF